LAVQAVEEVVANAETIDSQINEKLNEALYNRLIQDAKASKDPGTATAY
jgi:hypothetical protein